MTTVVQLIRREVRCNVKNDSYRLPILMQLHVFPDGVEVPLHRYIDRYIAVIAAIIADRAAAAPQERVGRHPTGPAHPPEAQRLLPDRHRGVPERVAAVIDIHWPSVDRYCLCPGPRISMSAIAAAYSMTSLSSSRWPCCTSPSRSLVLSFAMSYRYWPCLFIDSFLFLVANMHLVSIRI